MKLNYQTAEQPRLLLLLQVQHRPRRRLQPQVVRRQCRDLIAQPPPMMASGDVRVARLAMEIDLIALLTTLVILVSPTFADIPTWNLGQELVLDVDVFHLDLVIIHRIHWFTENANGPQHNIGSTQAQRGALERIQGIRGCQRRQTQQRPFGTGIHHQMSRMPQQPKLLNHQSLLTQVWAMMLSQTSVTDQMTRQLNYVIVQAEPDLFQLVDVPLQLGMLRCKLEATTIRLPNFGAGSTWASLFVSCTILIKALFAVLSGHFIYGYGMLLLHV